MEQQLVLVNESDEVTGVAGKSEVHKKGLLHRAFSIFIFNPRGELLLHRRALNKYHSGGLWTNTCCSHPSPGEDISEAALRRLKEEMGFETAIREIFDFVYKAEFQNGLVEHEFDHVFVGEYDGVIAINKEEVMDYCYKDMEKIVSLVKNEPAQFTQWFQLAFPKMHIWWKQQYKDMIAE